MKKFERIWNSIECRYDSEFLRVREKIVRAKENFFRIERHFSLEEYNWLWDYFIEQKEDYLASWKDEPSDFKVVKKEVNKLKNYPSAIDSKEEFFDLMDEIFEYLEYGSFNQTEENKRIVKSIIKKLNS